FRGEIDKYTWVDVGASYLPSDILAGFLWAQLEAAETIQARRRAIWSRYATALDDWAPAHGVQLPVVPGYCEQPAHLFHLIMPSESDRDGLIAHLRDRGVNSVFHYLPLHASPMGRRWPLRMACPVTERVSSRLLRLPFYTALDDERQQV